MDKKYKELMQQQQVSREVTEQFYGKLENPQPQRRPIRWKAAIAAACIALMIPLTAFAVEYLFSTPTVKLGKLDWHDSPNGFSVQFDNLEDFPLEAFPKELQNITQLKRVSCASWEAAEDALGIDLLNNTMLEQAKKITMDYDDLGSVHSQILYNPYEGQLYYVSVGAYYLYHDVQLSLKAKITVEHPMLDAETSQALHGVEGVTESPEDTPTSCETYTTKAGLPVAILRRDLVSVIHYDAVFAGNDISYELNAFIHPEKEEAEKQILLDVLDSFVLR